MGMGLCRVFEVSQVEQDQCRLDCQANSSESSVSTSRAFPPVMVSSPDEQVPRSLVGPVLLPGMDIFNHARGVPVTWRYPFLPDTNSSKQPSSSTAVDSNIEDAQRRRGVALELGYRVPAGEQVFNCYGGKSNEEFLCGYGFVLPEGADDQLTLVLGSGNDSSTNGGGGVKTERKGADMHGVMADSDLVDAGHPSASASGSNTPITALTASRPWGSKHYWRIVHPSSSEKGGAPAGLLVELRERLQKADCDEAAAAGEEDTSFPPRVQFSWLLRPHFATPPSPPTGDGEEQEERLDALRLDGEVLEALEGLLCAKRKAFKAVQKEVDAFGGAPRGVRPEVFQMVAIYRKGEYECAG